MCLPGKRLPKVANGLARFLGNKSGDVTAFLLVNMSNVKPGYKNGLIFGNVSGMISSFSLISIVVVIVSYDSLNDFFMKIVSILCKVSLIFIQLGNKLLYLTVFTEFNIFLQILIFNFAI